MAIPDNYIDKITKGNDSRMISPAADMVRVNNDNFDGETLDEVLDDVAQAISEAAGAEVNVQADWNQTTTTADDYIKNKPTLAAVATSGSYNDLTDKPTIPSAYDDTALAARVTVLEGQTHNVTYNQSTTTLTIQ